MSNKQEDSMLNTNTEEALRILIDCIKGTNSSVNSTLLDKYKEIVEKSESFDDKQKDEILKNLGFSRSLNQLNVKNLAELADNLDISEQYFLPENKNEKEK